MSSIGQITLTSVTKRFGTTVAVDDVSLEIRGGEFFSLLGPSGCGKTTTLRIIGGFVPPSAGTVEINGDLMRGVPPNRRPVNTVFQSYALFPHKTVAQNIGFGLQMRKIPKAEIAAAVERSLDLIRLPGYGSRCPGDLSGGEKQRVALARALINEPTILLLDEPLSALDLKLRKQMQQELKTLQRHVGITFVYVTHDQGEALALSDRIGVMHAGKLLQVGSPTDIYDSPRSRFVADFIGTSNFLEGKLISEDEVVLAVGVPFKFRCTPSLDVPLDTVVTLAIRPEHFEITAAPAADSPNLLLGVIRDKSYLGTMFQYTVQTDYPTPLIVHQQNIGVRGNHPFAPGDTVYLQCSPANTMLLKGD